MIGPQALQGEREHSVTLDLDMAISDKIITEKEVNKTVLLHTDMARIELDSPYEKMSD